MTESFYLEQMSFAGGEIDPALHETDQLPVVTEGALVMKDSIVTKTRNCLVRYGTKHVADVLGNGRAFVVQVSVQGDQNYIVVVGPSAGGDIRIFKNSTDGTVVTGIVSVFVSQQIRQMTASLFTTRGTEVHLVLFTPTKEPRVLTYDILAGTWDVTIPKFESILMSTRTAALPLFGGLPRIQSGKGTIPEAAQLTVNGGETVITSDIDFFEANDVSGVDLGGGASSESGAIIIVDGRAYRCSVFTNSKTMTVVKQEGTGGSPGGPTSLWARGWSRATGFPRMGRVAKGRFWMIGIDRYPEIVIGSRSDLFLDYDPDGSNDDADAITVDLRDTISVNGLQWLFDSGDDLLVGDQDQELALVGDLSILDLSVQKHSAQGGKPRVPVRTGDSILFVGRDGKSVHETTFSDAVQRYLSPAVNEHAEHLFIDRGINSLTEFRNPETFILVACDDEFDQNDNPQECRAFSYRKDAGIFAWSPWSMIVGSAAATTLPSGSLPETTGPGDKMWLIVLRGSTWTIETMEPSFPRLDSFVRVIGAPLASTTVTGLDHLDGVTVECVSGADPNWRSFGEAVVASGSATFEALQPIVDDAQNLTIFVGKKLDWELQPMVRQSLVNKGPSHGRQRQCSQVHLSVHKSFGGTVEGGEDVDSPIKSIDTGKLLDGVPVAVTGWFKSKGLRLNGHQPSPSIKNPWATRFEVRGLSLEFNVED